MPSPTQAGFGPSNGRNFVAAAFAVCGLVVLAFAPSSARAAELLMFDNPDCPWCLAWHRDVGPGYAKSVEGRRAPLRRVALAHQSGVKIVLAARVVATPTFVLVDNGREVGRITGYPGADFFWGMLEDLMSRLDQPA